ncbi:MAG: hypothetical protein ACI9FD_004953, partial [Gammaproteobacteria bacterium]
AKQLPINCERESDVVFIKKPELPVSQKRAKLAQTS